jgi:hypothetical protein
MITIEEASLLAGTKAAELIEAINDNQIDGFNIGGLDHYPYLISYRGLIDYVTLKVEQSLRK